MFREMQWTVSVVYGRIGECRSSKRVGELGCSSLSLFELCLFNSVKK